MTAYLSPATALRRYALRQLPGPRLFWADYTSILHGIARKGTADRYRASDFQARLFRLRRFFLLLLFFLGPYTLKFREKTLFRA